MITTLLLAFAAQDQGVIAVKGDTKLTLGAELRFRAETRDPSPAVEGADSDTFSTGRFRVNFDAMLNPNVRAFLQLQETVVTDGATSTESIHQAFGELKGLGGMMDLQVGRFEMIYGDELHVGQGDWGNTGRSFDGIRLHRMDDSYWVDVFMTQPVEGQAVNVGLDQAFGGVYGGVPGDGWSAEGYVLVRDTRNDGGTGDDDMTIGGRFTMKTDGGLGIKAEAATQSGDHAGGLDAAGMMVMTDVGMKVNADLNVGINVLYASGDDDATDSDNDAFKILYNSPHKILGSQDLVLMTNVLDAQLYAGYAVSEKWKLYSALHWMELAEDTGALPDLKGGWTAAAGESDLGIELDVSLRGPVMEDTDLWVGVSQFMAGDAIANGDDQLWAFAQLIFRI